MRLHAIMRFLHEADTNQLRPEFCHGRYVAVADIGGEEFHREADSLYAALGRLADVLVATSGCDSAEELVEALDEPMDDALADEADGDDEAARPEPLRSPALRVVRATMTGDAGPMDIVTEHHAADAYLGHVLEDYPGSRFVMLASAAPPNQDLALGIVELQPTGTLTEHDTELVDACARGDIDALRAALSSGARVDALDDQGMTPLHTAVAYRQPAAVAALVAAGADVNLQASYGNAAYFATLDDGQVEPSAELLTDDSHRRIVRSLIEAGAEINAVNRWDETILDLAIRTVPYPADEIGFLLANGAHSAKLAGRTLAHFANPFSYPKLINPPYEGEPRFRVELNTVRFLLETDPQREISLFHALNLGTGHTLESELPGAYLVELVDLFLEHGVVDTPYHEGETALFGLERWARSGYAHYEPAAERLRAAASQD